MDKPFEKACVAVLRQGGQDEGDPGWPHDTCSAHDPLEVDGVMQPYWAQIFWAGLTGVALLPSTVIPVGPGSSGLPVGIQVVANYLDDRTALRFAELMDPLTGGFTAPPNL